MRLLPSLRVRTAVAVALVVALLPSPSGARETCSGTVCFELDQALSIDCGEGGPGQVVDCTVSGSATVHARPWDASPMPGSAMVRAEIVGCDAGDACRPSDSCDWFLETDGCNAGVAPPSLAISVALPADGSCAPVSAELAFDGYVASNLVVIGLDGEGFSGSVLAGVQVCPSIE